MPCTITGVSALSRMPIYRVISTIFSAASQPLAPSSMPFSFRMARPSSSLVPERRTTSGRVILRLSRACTRPLATSSPRVMPPKTLISTPRTLGFIRITVSAFSTTSARAPPPMSQKLAARPPPRPLDHVQGAHAEPCTVADDADLAVERYVREVPLLRFDLVGVALKHAAVPLLQRPLP